LAGKLETKEKYDTIQYDVIEEFNVDSKAECDQPDVAHIARNKI